MLSERGAIERIRRRLRHLRARRNRTGFTRPVLDAGVDVFERRSIAGWVSVRRRAGSTPVELCVNGQSVARTWAAPAGGDDADTLLRFRFAVTDLWKYVKRTDRVSVRIGGQAVPIADRGTSYRPRRDGDASLADLRRLLAEGHVFGQDGRLRLSKTLDTGWQSAVLGLYDRVNAVLSDRLGTRAFLCYGSLLGVVRDGGFIGHDVDFDCAYLSRHRTGRAAADELGDVALALIDAGFNVIPKRTCLAISDAAASRTKIDLYHLYRNATGELCFPFGIAGTPSTSTKAFSGVRTVRLGGHDVLIPSEASRLVEVIYGPTWRTPNPGFNWRTDRTHSAREGIVAVEQVDEVARANLAPTQDGQRRRIRAVLGDDGGLPVNTVIEVGSSVGRETVDIARTGKRVIALERSQRSTARARDRLASEGMTPLVTHRTVEINDPDLLWRAVAESRRNIGGVAVALYVRAYLDFSDRALRATVNGLGRHAQAGDYLVADFRTAPRHTWPRDKSQPAVSPWTPTDLLAALAQIPQCSIVRIEPAIVGTGHNDQRAQAIVARIDSTPHG